MRWLPALLFIWTAPLLARVNFGRDVKPILENNCVRCHGVDGAMRGIRLDKKERALMTVVPKKPDDSLLYNIVKIGAMPPGPQKLTPAQLETLRKWIAEGARWPQGIELVGKNPFLGAASMELRPWQYRESGRYFLGYFAQIAPAPARRFRDFERLALTRFALAQDSDRPPTESVMQSLL